MYIFFVWHKKNQKIFTNRKSLFEEKISTLKLLVSTLRSEINILWTLWYD